MRRTSIDSSACNGGPYGEQPIPFDTVLEKPGRLKLDGIERGGVDGYPDPRNHPTKDDRAALKTKVAAPGLACAGLAQEDIGHHWWTGDLGFWPDVRQATAECNTALDELDRPAG
jgi:hypothetical protein